MEITGSVPTEPPEEVSGGYMPLALRWPTGTPAGGVFWDIDGENGGHVEIKFNVTDGALEDVTVLDAPPVVDRVAERLPVGARSPGEVPCVSLRAWAPGPDLEPGTTHLSQRLPLRAVEHSDGATAVLFGIGSGAVRWHSYAGVSVGVTEENQFAGVAWHSSVIDDSPEWRQPQWTDGD